MKRVQATAPVPSSPTAATEWVSASTSSWLEAPCEVIHPSYLEPLTIGGSYINASDPASSVAGGATAADDRARAGNASSSPAGAAATTAAATKIKRKRRGVLLEVRRLWIPPRGPSPAAGPGEGIGQDGPLYGFVRIEQCDHRQSGWFLLKDILLLGRSKRGGASGKGPNKAADSDGDEGGADGSPTLPHAASKGGHPSADPMRADHHITAPVLSPVYTQVTDGMVRTQGGNHRVIDYMEERLLRDNRTPTTVRYFLYLHHFAFAPWYYAPFGLLNAEFDPMPPPPPRTVGAVGPAAAVYERELTRMQGSLKDAYLCPFSLRVYTTAEQMAWETARWRTQKGCGLRPPGREIYCDDRRGISVFELNGSKETTFCRHLFLIGKSFLENKLAGHDVMNYTFYVVGLHHRFFPDYVDDPSAIYVAGYFSREKHVTENNLACIVTLPCFAGGAPASAGPASPPPVPRHLGQFMIALSYELAYRRGTVGTPERPLSDFGEAAYQRYWRRRLLEWALPAAESLHPVVVIGDSSDSDAEGELRPGKGKAKGKAKRGKRRREEPSSSDDDNESENGGTAADSKGGGPRGKKSRRRTLTLRQMASEMRLEEGDVKEAVLAMGLLHRVSEDHGMRLMLPVQYIRHAVALARAREAAVEYATLDPALLRRGSSDRSK